jgi:plastocyanin
VFKSWQVFVFSLIPLALVLTGVIIGSIHFSGGDSQAEVFPTPRPNQSSGPPPTPIPGATSLQITAQNLAFSTRTLSATANQPVQLAFNNADAGVVHNFAIFNNSSKTTNLYRSPPDVGPKTENLTFTAPAPGTYFFVCEAHPDTMTGSFTAR